MKDDDERYLTAKELAGELQERGLTYSTQWVRDAWKIGCPSKRRRHGTMEAMLDWMDRHPMACPRAKDPKRRMPVKNRGMTLI